MGRHRRRLRPDAPLDATCGRHGTPIRTLFGLELARDTVAEIDRRMAELRRPGFYRTVLDIAGVGVCQVNSLQSTFQRTADPERLQQDIGLTDFVLPSPRAVAEWEAVTGREVARPARLLAVMGEYFERFGPAGRRGQAGHRLRPTDRDPPGTPPALP